MTNFELKYKGNYRWEVVCGSVVLGYQSNLMSEMEATEWAKAFCSSFSSYNLVMKPAIEDFWYERKQKENLRNGTKQKSKNNSNSNSNKKEKIESINVKSESVIIQLKDKEEQTLNSETLVSLSEDK